ncbi:MAG: glycosyltransferase family 4 protein [Candidatus Omnitrophica bacterium]|nr:glycosyltransferase family 4 protein [Candidatus Omnitrophota bacterium]
MDWGGSTDIVRILCEYANQEKYELTLITGQSYNKSRKTENFFESFKEHIVIVGSLKRDINLFFDLKALIELYQIFKKEKFDIVHTHTAKAGILGRLAARLAGIKVIVHTSHGHNFYGYFGSLMSKIIILAEKAASAITDKIITLTRLEADDLARYRVALKKKIVVVETAVEMKQERIIDENIRGLKRFGLDLPARALLVAMVARLEPIKGVEYFVNAAVNYCKRFNNVFFYCIGDGSLREFLQKKIDETGFNKNIFLIGWKDNPLEFMAVMDIVALASLNEAVGLVLIEAQKLGIPVVATRVGGIPEIVQDGISGILVDAANSDHLLGAMEELINNGEKRKKMAEQAYESMQNRFTPENFVKNVNEVYEGLFWRKKLS